MSLFTDLEFDADHEAVYGFGVHLSEEDCLKLSGKYRKAYKLCRQCLKGKMDRIEFCKKLIDFNSGYFDILKPYLSELDLKAVDENSAVFSDEEEKEEEQEEDDLSD